MKNTVVLLLIMLIGLSTFAQDYDVKKLETISEIWGECYLFHPSVIRADKDLNWEKQLVDFLPKIKQINTSEQFIDKINLELLAALEDPLTIVQSYKIKSNNRDDRNLKHTEFDYLKYSEFALSDFNQLAYLDSVIFDKTSTKPLILDCRINSELSIDVHTYSPFKYFMSMCIENKIPLSLSVTREHFGWDEYNDWWLYEQRWKIAQNDKHQKNNGTLMPFLAYQQDLQHNKNIQNFNFDDFSTIKRPIYFIVNKSFLSYYQSDLLALTSNRNQTFVIFENTGKVFSGQQGILRYSFDKFEFLLNTSFHINSNTNSINFKYISPSVSLDNLSQILHNSVQSKVNDNPFLFQISPKKYKSLGKELNMEEKILGVIKTWTIVKYFYPHLNNCKANWDSVLTKYLELVQNTNSDREYFTLIQEMMAKLKDSHVSTYHSSILDFSKIFVAPVKFEWIEDKVIITAIDSSVNADIEIGDEIIAIDNVTINNLLKQESKKISSSNRQGLLATVINPGYFIGMADSKIRFKLKSSKELKIVEIPRTRYVFHFMDFGDNRVASTILDNNIGYINLARFTNSLDLENALLKMKHTKSLILDLRNSYPTEDYKKFLQMLCQQNVTIRNSKVPIISANQYKIWQYETSTISPLSSFSYETPIVVLIDKTMISRPEDIAIALKSFDNVTFIGEQTQGTDGEMTKIHLPGGGETSFTGQVVEFGNGEKFQNIGIIPDIEVQRTIEGIKKGKDEILEVAISWLEKN